MNDLNRMINSLKRLSYLKPNNNGLIEVKITKKALEEIIGYLEDLKKIHSIFETREEF